MTDRYFVYILYSKTLDRFYTGFSKYRRKRRRLHVRGETVSTSRADDWVEVFCAETEIRETARELEKKVKARGAERFICDMESGNGHVDQPGVNVLTIVSQPPNAGVA